MTDHSSRTFTGDFKRFFLRGLVVLLPSVLTLWILVKAYQFVDSSVAQPINSGVRLAVTRVAGVWEPLRSSFDPDDEAVETRRREMIQSGALAVPRSPDEAARQRQVVRTRLRGEAFNEWWRAHWAMDLIGLGVAIIAVYFAGRLLGGLIGRRAYKRLEQLITQVPVIKQVYPSVKQVVDFLFGGDDEEGEDKPIKFNRVVAAEYPRKGIWSVGFLTGGTLKTIAATAGDCVTIFIPSSPTPFTGYTITVPRTEVIELPITVDEAIRFAVSGGVLVPPREEMRVPGLEGVDAPRPPAPTTDPTPSPATEGA